MKELSLHLLDLIQNAIEASATKIQVDFYLSYQDDVMTLKVIDNGRGMDDKFKQQATDPFKTSRKTRKVGLGLSLLQMKAEQCDGDINISSSPWGQGTQVNARFKYSHWDRPPLGKLSNTFISILQGNPDLKLYFSYQVENKLFKFSTEEIKEIVHQNAFRDLEVLMWVKQYLEENITSLNGGD
ncbi:ATP-binding protein [Natranaerobius thermophilus]|uniref:Histidine kinase n=1 Tax=Natranaerobius thermophilus (strain ATCC BAA-1301 / DSM 18059 / JW/NM-WN-LF) TaxID=457570 RepID=B2A3S0_NATTJ|nr:ATP-binding protein [Natranaerobius thermophilus]ACB83696.1 histidine kinase [Natranaerobius thermophilus JW/NM-WN-LF]